MKNCVNHPDKKALSVCHGCGKDFCADCLKEGKTYYYCSAPECIALYRQEMGPEPLPEIIVCPNCGAELQLSDKERNSRTVNCGDCEARIDYNKEPPEITPRDEYREILSSLNQGDISLIMSILDDAQIDYYTTGKNFISVRPLLEPVRFFVNIKQEQDAREALKDFELHIWGASAKNY